MYAPLRPGCMRPSFESVYAPLRPLYAQIRKSPNPYDLGPAYEIFMCRTGGSVRISMRGGPGMIEPHGKHYIRMLSSCSRTLYALMLL